MIKNFETSLSGVPFRFNTISSTTLVAFQVYTPVAGRTLRFHMQRKGEAFFITDALVCPAELLALEAELSQAILQSQIKK